MKLPAIQGVIRSRLLVNYRVDPRIIAAMLPPPFKAQRISGFGIAGICLIRLAELRTAWLPSKLGLSVDSVAHRVAVEWREGDEMQRGVFIFRRDCPSRIIRLLGGRLFPGIHSGATLDITETVNHIAWSVKTADGNADVEVVGRTADWSEKSVFEDLAHATQFFADGACGFSPNRNGTGLDALQLSVPKFDLIPVHIEKLRSTFCDDERRFPAGTISPDSAFIMRDVPHEWHNIDSPKFDRGRAFV